MVDFVELSDLAIADLERSGIAPEDAEYAGIYSVDTAREVYDDFEDRPALVLPYYNALADDDELIEFTRDDERLEFARVRYLDKPKQKRGFKKQKTVRYGQPERSGVHPYFPVTELFDWREVAEDPSQEIVITEGEKKALAGCLAGVPTIGLGGVYNFMSEGELLALVGKLVWKKRNVYINYDSDAADNPQIQAAEARLAEQLSLKRGARVYLTRLPDTPDGEKQGIDDIIVNEGEDAWHGYLRASKELRKIDSAVLSLNKHICWIDTEGKAFEYKSGVLIPKTDLHSGSAYSSQKIQVPNMKGDGVKEVSVPALWLEHEHATRFSKLVFDPSTTEKVVYRDDLACLNTYKDIRTVEGDVQPFLDLCEHISSGLPRELKDFLFKLAAYKFQNPEKKIPIAPVLIGKGGSGKSTFGNTLTKALGPYGKTLESKALLSDFNPWVEKSIIICIDEAQSDHMRRGKGLDYLKTLISEKQQTLNVKYRAQVPVDNPGLYILTSNDRRVAQFEHDDRRFFVVEVRKNKPPEFYARYHHWLDNQDGAAKLAHYLINYDLKGWRPPAHAPVTAEKRMGYMMSLSEIQRVAEAMKEAEGDNLIRMYLEQALNWAYANEASPNGRIANEAREVAAAAMNMPIRSIYTANELAMILPHLAFTMQSSKIKQPPASYLAQQLMDVGINYLRNPDDVRGHRWRGRWDHYYVVADIDSMPDEMSQNEFERQMEGTKTFAQMRKKS
jgi:hypothetical protein